MPIPVVVRAAALGGGSALVLTALCAAAPPIPPLPPIAPSEPAAAAAPPVPEVFAWSGGHQQMVTVRDVQGRTTVVARDPGAAPPAMGHKREVLSYRDAAGRDVRVFSDHEVTRAEADRMLDPATVEAGRRRAADTVRDAVAAARLTPDEQRSVAEAARLAGEQGRRIAEESRGIARAAAARAYAALGRREAWALSGDRDMGAPPAPDPPSTAAPELLDLQRQMQRLREEMKALRAELRENRGAR